jgi:hypothetical protein
MMHQKVYLKVYISAIITMRLKVYILGNFFEETPLHAGNLL